MVMAYHVKPRNIYIVGAQNTGKTTLVKALRDHFNQDETYPPRVITEVARTVLEKHSFTADDIKSSPARALALQQLILQAQVNAERLALKEGKWFISDRSGIDPIVYAVKHVSKDAKSHLIKSAEWLELRDRMRESVIVVCEAGADWLTDDGVRLMPESREDWIDFHQLFCRCLDELGLNYEVLPCGTTSLRERVSFVLWKWKAPQVKLSKFEGV
jgi:predicted ATPase